MSKKANPTLIGAFVLGAAALLIGAIVVFGSGRFFTETREYVLYFEGSVKGLRAGAPVKFRGVDIGSVSEINLLCDTEVLNFFIQVKIEVDPNRYQLIGGKDIDGMIDRLGHERFLELLFDRGLRAQLQLESLVTGKLFVQLDLTPEKPIRLMGLDDKLVELPTVPSELQEIGKTVERLISKLEALPLNDLLSGATSLIKDTRELINAPEIRSSIQNLNEALIELKQLASNLDKRTGPVVSSIEQTSLAAQKTLEKLQDTLASMEGVTGEDSVTIYQLNRALKELADAARSLRLLGQFLEQHPDAILRGKKEEVKR